MYLEHYRLREFPFGLTPDTTFFLNRAGYQDALNVLLVAMRSGEGFVKVVGEVGTGKTLLSRKLLNTLSEEFTTAFIHNPYLDPTSLLAAVADELHVSVAGCRDQHSLLKRLGERLLVVHGEGKRVMLALDEAQAMPVETLETLRLLTNLETEKRKLLQVVLFGQPELDRVLSERSIRQLRQRITFSYRLLPMNRLGIGTYVGHRLCVAGYDGPPLFSRRALDLVHRSSRGIPRLVNVICHKAMMVGYGEGSRTVTRSCVRHAVTDTASVEEAPRPLRWWPATLRWLAWNRSS